MKELPYALGGSYQGPPLSLSLFCGRQVGMGDVMISFGHHLVLSRGKKDKQISRLEQE